MNLPSNPDAEQSVLGSILLDNTALVKVLPKLRATDFLDQRNAQIYGAMCEMYRKDEPIDIVTLMPLVKVPAEYITHLLSLTPTHENAESYARVVLECATKRRFIQAANKIAEWAYDSTPADELPSLASEQILGAMPRRNGGFIPIAELMPDFSLGVMERLGNPQEISGVTSGYKDLDKVLGGYKTGFHVIAGRPSMGKTRYMLSQVNRQIQYRIPVAVLTLEMSVKQLMTAIAAMRSDFTTQTIETGLIDGKPLNDDQQAKLKHAIHQLDDLPLYLKYGGGMDSLAVRATIDELILRDNVKCVWIDYLQLLTDKGENRNLALGSATRNLFNAAVALDIPIIALSQLNRATERSESKKPKMEELRDSGSIEQDADTITMLYREDYYKAQTERDYKPTGEAWAYIAKDRLGSGANQSVQFYFHPTKGSFEPVVKGAK